MPLPSPASTSLVVDADTGAVVVDSSLPQRVGAPLGRRNDRRFVQLAAAGAPSGTATVADHRTAFGRLAKATHNANDWYVVAVDPQPAGSLLNDVGWAPIGMAAAASALTSSPASASGLAARAPRSRTHRRAHRPRQPTEAPERPRSRLRTSRRRRALHVLYDLNGFKSCNDTFGHLPEDALLHGLAAKLAEATVDWGAAYRLGGDEFCVLSLSAAAKTQQVSPRWVRARWRGER